MTELITLPEVWVLPIGAIISLLVGLGTPADAENKTRALIAVVASAGVAVLEQIIAESFTVQGLGTTFATVFVTQLVAYVGAWTHFNVNDRGVGARDGAMSAGR